MKHAFSRLETKVNYALGKIEKTEYDERLKFGMKKFEKLKEETNQMKTAIKNMLPKDREQTKIEHLAETLSRIAGQQESGTKLAKIQEKFGECTLNIGKEERQMARTVDSKTLAGLDGLLKVEFNAYKKKKDQLEKARVDMDRLHAKVMRTPSDDPNYRQLKREETVARENFDARRKDVLSIVDKTVKFEKDIQKYLIALAKAQQRFYATAAEIYDRFAKEFDKHEEQRSK
ncbi:unnamed protein product [Soboliphyme baturini]|uniref:BAR domain-containing protein n=1 Tax=Soboliphyme baturini TaxID=241478 RepID=A0A183IUK0_9BILA|nr:unnamed protein product [Soboliphyme baturini]